MGMERVIAFSGRAPAWEAIQKELGAAGLPVVVRMIDGLPAFPDEVPAEGWREVRISTPAGMMTLRQQPGGIAVVVWENADEQLLREWEKVVEACMNAAQPPWKDPLE
jgi:hypothetical protein